MATISHHNSNMNALDTDTNLIQIGLLSESQKYLASFGVEVLILLPQFHPRQQNSNLHNNTIFFARDNNIGKFAIATTALAVSVLVS
eukprot:13726381-Ditylum_brightwellii.AAC.1